MLETLLKQIYWGPSTYYCIKVYVIVQLNDFLYFLFNNVFYCCPSIVVSIFPPPRAPALPIPASYAQTYPLWLCPWVLYTCSLMTLPPFPHIIPSHLPSGYCQFVPLWLYFACLFVSLIRLYLFLCATIYLSKPSCLKLKLISILHHYKPWLEIYFFYLLITL